MPFERVLLTGAAGRVGTVLRPGLRGGRVELRLSDVAPIEAQDAVETIVPADLLDTDAVARAVEGVGAVVHLGGIPEEADFATLSGPNVHGTFNLFEAARRAGVRRVVFASSNHATGAYPAGMRLSGAEPVRPDTLYGVTKAYGEALGRMYADKFGLEVACVRIGSLDERPTEPRHLHTWLSHGDAGRLFAALLDAPSPLEFTIAYGASANTRGWWDLSPALALGYAPSDDAEAFAGEITAGPQPALQGGEFAEPGHGGWAAG